MVGWLSLSRARWLLWWGDRGLWCTPLGGPQKAASPPSPACHSPHLGPAVTPCGRAAVNCGCWLVKRHSEGSRIRNPAGEVPFTVATTRGYSGTVSQKRGNSRSWQRLFSRGVVLISFTWSALFHRKHEGGCVCVCVCV